jgi:hypothetical protein
VRGECEVPPRLTTGRRAGWQLFMHKYVVDRAALERRREALAKRRRRGKGEVDDQPTVGDDKDEDEVDEDEDAAGDDGDAPVKTRRAFAPDPRRDDDEGEEQEEEEEDIDENDLEEIDADELSDSEVDAAIQRSSTPARPDRPTPGALTGRGAGWG